MFSSSYPNPTDFNAVTNHRNLKHFNAYHLIHHKNTFKDQCLQRRRPLVSKQSTHQYPCFAECYGITYVSDGPLNYQLRDNVGQLPHGERSHEFSIVSYGSVMYAYACVVYIYIYQINICVYVQ